MRVVRLVLERILLVLGGVVVALALLEGGLQVAASFQRAPTARPNPAIGATGVLALGDSNTFGLYLAPEQAYPMVFEQTWNRDHPDAPVLVFNAGVPGASSWRILDDIDRLLATFQPSVVTLMVGANDAWTEPSPSHHERPWWTRLRLHRLAQLVMHRASGGRPSVEFSNPAGQRPNRGTLRFGVEEFDFGWTQPAATPPERWAWHLRQNVHRILDRIQRAGATPILLTYAASSDLYGAANNELRQIALRRGVGLIDVAQAFSRRCPEGGCADLYFPSRHPTALGHQIIAELLATPRNIQVWTAAAPSRGR
jgi:lysophospholipase L1-like esterase